jgi:hypothetical protein
MPLVTEADLYHAARRLDPPALGSTYPDPGPMPVAGPGEVPSGDLRAALDRCGRWLDESFRPHLRVLVGVVRAESVEPGLYVPGEAGRLPGSAARLDGLRAAGVPAALLWFGDAGTAGFGELLVRVGWGAETVRASLAAAGYRAVLDTRSGLVRQAGSAAGHLVSLVVAEPAGAGS